MAPLGVALSAFALLAGAAASSAAAQAPAVAEATTDGAPNPSTLLADLRTMLADEAFTDVSFSVEGQAIAAHLKRNGVPRHLQRRVQEFYTFMGGVAEATPTEQLLPALPHGLAFQPDLLQKRAGDLLSPCTGVKACKLA